MRFRLSCGHLLLSSELSTSPGRQGWRATHCRPCKWGNCSSLWVFACFHLWKVFFSFTRTLCVVFCQHILLPGVRRDEGQFFSVFLGFFCSGLCGCPISIHPYFSAGSAHHLTLFTPLFVADNRVIIAPLAFLSDQIRPGIKTQQILKLRYELEWEWKRLSIKLKKAE